jgi:ACT domain-containing protein
MKRSRTPRPTRDTMGARRAPSARTGRAATRHTAPQAAPLSGRAIVTIIGSDRVGIIAGIANVIAEANVNILDISQSVIREFFTMIMMVDLSAATISFEALADNLARKGANLGVKVEIQREEIFKAMHRI